MGSNCGICQAVFRSPNRNKRTYFKMKAPCIIEGCQGGIVNNQRIRMLSSKYMYRMGKSLCSVTVTSKLKLLYLSLGLMEAGYMRS